MIRARLNNRRVAAVVSLFAALAFVVVSQIHVDGGDCCWSGTAHQSLQHSSQTHQALGAGTTHHQPHCVACEMMALGTGNTIPVSNPQIEPAQTQQALTSAADCFIQQTFLTLLSSRAPPV